MVVKFVKEVLTLVIDVLFPIIPSASFKAIVKKVRDIVNVIDGWLEKIQGFLLKVTG